MNYAGFWKRFAAALIDLIILSLALLLVPYLGLIIVWVYQAGFESSKLQATPGAMVLKIKVTNLEGNRIRFWNATGRYLGEFLSYITCGIGYIMIAFTEKKQGLHDKISGCLVVNKDTKENQ